MSTKNLPKWQQKLTAKQRKHLRAMGITSLRGMKTCAEFQADKRKNRPEYGEPCWECRDICDRLGLEV